MLTGLGISGALLLVYRPEFSAIHPYWSGLGFLPLLLYLGACFQQERKRINVEIAVEREIIIADLRLIAAHRCARFWAAGFAVACGSAFLAALLVWAYQAATWYRTDVWRPLTWNSVLGLVPNTGNAGLQKVIHWLSDTNLGVVAIVLGLLIAAPLASLNHNANLTVHRRKKELATYKKTPVSSYDQ